jgi:hypothetical protein
MKRHNKTLTPEMLLRKIGKSMAHLSKMNFLETYAIFMGKAQLVEFALKKILRQKYRYGERKLARMTLGAAITELDQNGLRKDFVALLRQLNEFRINMAHEFLADHAHLSSWDRRFGHLSLKSLRYALWKVEETIQVFDHLNQNRMLYKRQRKAY